MQKKTLKLDLQLDSAKVNELLAERTKAALIKPELVSPEHINSPQSYNRFRQMKEKSEFREKLISALSSKLTKLYDTVLVDQLAAKLIAIFEDIDKNGAITIGNMINFESFSALIDQYTQKLSINGSKSWIHSYINLGNHPDFLTNADFNGAFIHPLLVVAIAYAAGGPVRIVDARGKDAEPLAVQAQDNMLHIDNTPFRKEFKIITTWKQGEVSGPSGQNFVYIPGTHKGVRNCKVNEDGQAWSTEDASIFISEQAVQQVFQFQNEIAQIPATVVEVSHPTMPLTTVFEAGALIHHRYRTQEKNISRSCIIVAIHRAQDNPGQFLSNEHLEKYLDKNSLLGLMMGSHLDNTEDKFIAAILSQVTVIAEKITELNSMMSDATIVAASERILSEPELKQWQKAVTCAPTVAELKMKKKYFNIRTNLTTELLFNVMAFDKHGPLDLILYADGHEEIRKWARNRIREMSPTKLAARVSQLEDLLVEPAVEQFLTTAELYNHSNALVSFMDQIPERVKDSAKLDPTEKISKHDAFRSLKQLVTDLGEAIVRCSSRQAFLSTSLFLFWASDELIQLIGDNSLITNEMHSIHSQLLAHYVTCYVLVEKQIKNEQAIKLTYSVFNDFRKDADTNLEPNPIKPNIHPN